MINEGLKMDTNELINKWKKEDLITKYGEFRHDKIYRKYGEEKAIKLIENITYQDIWESMDYKQLKKLALCMIDDMKIDLQKNKIYIDDAEDFLSVMIILLMKYIGD